MLYDHSPHVYLLKLPTLQIIMFINLYNHIPYMYYLYHDHHLSYILHILCENYIFLALVEPSEALLPTTCQPKAVGGVCYDTITDHITDT